MRLKLSETTDKKKGTKWCPFMFLAVRSGTSPLRFDFDFPLGRHCPKPVVPGVRLVLFQFGLRFCVCSVVCFAMCSSCSYMKLKSVNCYTNKECVTIVDN